MEKVIYEKDNFKIYEVDDGFILHNTDKEFKEGHTHIKRYKSCLYLIDLIQRKLIPHDLNGYFLDSLKRLSTDEKYINKITQLQESKKNKTFIRYYNKTKVFKKKR